MAVLLLVGLLAALGPSARAGGAVASVPAPKTGSVVPKLGLGGVSFKVGGRTFADWGFQGLPVSVQLRRNFLPQPALSETPMAPAGGAAEAAAVAETLAAPDLHLAPGRGLILDPGPNAPPNAGRPQSLPARSAAVKAELLKTGPVARVSGESAQLLGRRVMDLLTGTASLEGAGAGLKPVAGLAQGLSAPEAPGTAWNAGETASGAGLAAKGGARDGAAQSETVQVPAPDPQVRLAPRALPEAGWLGTWRALPSRVSRIAMRAFRLGLSFSPRLSHLTTRAANHDSVAAEPGSQGGTAPFIWKAVPETPAQEIPLVVAEQAPIQASWAPAQPEGELFAYHQSAGEKGFARADARAPEEGSGRGRRLAPLQPGGDGGLFTASLLPLVGLALLAGYKLN